MSTVAIVRPESDPVERGLSSWAALLLMSIQGKSGVVTTDLRGVAVTRARVVTTVTGKDVTLLFSHGTKTALGTPVSLIDATNVSCFKGSVVVAFSCLAGDQLGPGAAAHGARAFLGFDDVLTNYLTQPNLFGQGVEKAATALVLNRKTVATTRTALEKHFKQIERGYHTGPHRRHVDATVIWLAAHVNWRGLIVHGSASATV
jgi:hypothetical protein